MIYMRSKVFAIFFAILAIINHAHAQLCQGSLGDPIINTTFGSGPNPGPPLSAATTNYQYIAGDCPNDGFYTVRNSTASCFGNSWHSFSSDHTGNPNGYFMLVNASIQPSDFYLETVKGLCGNTTYEFAAWIMNVLHPSACSGNGIQPNLTFSIEQTNGTVLQTYNTGGISVTQAAFWKQYGFFFTTPLAVTDVVLRITNNSQGGCGNDLALDDITFRPCGPLLTAGITGNASDTVSFCEGTPGTFTFTCSVSGGFNNPVFQWQERLNNGSWTDIPLANTNSLTKIFTTISPPGNYQYRLSVAEIGNLGSAQCRIASRPLTVIINKTPVPAAVNDGPGCTGNTSTLKATGGTQYVWTGPNGFTGSDSSFQLSNIQLNQAGKYYVTVTSTAGCSNTDSTTLIVNPSPAATVNLVNATLCAGDSIQLIAGGGPSYTWIPATGLSNANVFNPKASPVQTTIYSMVVSNQFSCKDTAVVNINIILDPIVDAGPDKVILKGQSIQLSALVIGTGNSFSWSPSVFIDDIFSLQPVINPTADSRYILEVVSNVGCKSISDTMFVKVYNGIYIPNAFTPNGDGINDTWNIPALGVYPDFELFIYNRYGQLVFRTKNIPLAWNGKYKGNPCPNGAYTYLIKTGNGKDVIRGSVMLIR